MVIRRFSQTRKKVKHEGWSAWWKTFEFCRPTIDHSFVHLYTVEWLTKISNRIYSFCSDETWKQVLSEVALEINKSDMKK